MFRNLSNVNVRIMVIFFILVYLETLKNKNESKKRGKWRVLDQIPMIRVNRVGTNG